MLRVHHDVRILHGRSSAGGTVVGIGSASRIAFGMASDLDGAGFGAIRSELATFRAGAIVELCIPGFGGARVPHPGDFVAHFHMVLLVLFDYCSGVVNMELVQLLGKSLGG